MSSKRSTQEDTSLSVSLESLAKRQKTTLAKASSKKQEQDEADDDVPTSILPLRLTALGGYLPLKDAGRFLLGVSKDMTSSIFDDRMFPIEDEAAACEADEESADTGGEEALRRRQTKIRQEVWKCLCKHKWRNSKALDRMLAILGGASDGDTDWESLFRKFISSPEKPPARASVEDYSFMFSLYEGDRHDDFGSIVPLTTYILEENDAISFLRTGESGWLKLDAPVEIGNYACKKDITEVINGSGPSPDPVHRFGSMMHVMRKSDGKACELGYQNFWNGGKLSRGPGGPGGFRYHMRSGTAESLGKLRDLVYDVAGKFVGMDLSIVRDVQTTISEREDGCVLHHITHVAFTVSIFDGEDAEAFSDLEKKEGVTMADFIECLDVEWK